MTRVNELASVGWTIALGELPPVGLPPLEAMTGAMAVSRPFLGSLTVSRFFDRYSVGLFYAVTRR